MRVAGALGAIAVVASAACTLLVDTSGLTGGDAGATGDAASPPTDGAAPDAPGAPDATDAPADAVASACQGTIADSFDTAALGALWTGGDTNGGLALSLDSAEAVSPPRSLLVSVPKGSAGHAYLRKDFADAKTACCDLAMKSGSQNLSNVSLSGMGDNYGVTLLYGSGSFVVDEVYYAGSTDPGINREIGPLPYSSAWQRVHIEATLPQGSGVGTLRIAVDGVVAMNATLGGPTYDLSFSNLKVGVTYCGPDTVDRSARFDDVSCAFR